ncbi:hypothetical protein [Spirosoma koreense]
MSILTADDHLSIASQLLYPLIYKNAMMTGFYRFLIATLLNGALPGKQYWSVYSPSTHSQGHSIFQFDQFKKGTVMFRNRTSRQVLLNYNLMQGQLQFIHDNGDTLLFTNKYLIDKVVIDHQVFVVGVTDQDHDLELVNLYSAASLAKLTKLVAGGSSSSSSNQQFKASSSSTPSSLLVSSQPGEFQWQNTTLPLDWHRKTVYYLIDANGRSYPASQKSLHRLYQRQWSTVRAYLKAHSIDYSDLEDISHLLAFLDGKD